MIFSFSLTRLVTSKRAKHWPGSGRSLLVGAVLDLDGVDGRGLAGEQLHLVLALLDVEPRVLARLEVRQLLAVDQDLEPRVLRREHVDGAAAGEEGVDEGGDEDGEEDDGADELELFQRTLPRLTVSTPSRRRVGMAPSQAGGKEGRKDGARAPRRARGAGRHSPRSDIA
ncbi:MAG: hypothetical protein QM765_36185 [Myxococcales bacterium]